MHGGDLSTTLSRLLAKIAKTNFGIQTVRTQIRLLLLTFVTISSRSSVVLAGHVNIMRIHALNTGFFHLTYT